jgi:hypothetical protein
MADPKDPEGATPEEPTDPKPAGDENPPDDLGDKGKDAIRKEREARKAAEDRAKEAEAKLAEIDAEQAKRSEDEAKAKGEFEQLANKRAEALDKAKTDIKTLADERDALAERVAAYEARDRAAIAEGVKDLPDDVKAFDPGDDAPLDTRWTWFSKAQAIAAKRTTDPARGNGRSPEAANGRDAKADETARLQFERETSRRF